MMTLFATLHSFSDLGLLALRLAVAAVFWVHGRSKAGMWKMQPNPQMPAGMIRLMRLLSVAEPLSALALAAGLLTPLAILGEAAVMVGAITMKRRAWKVPFMAQDKTGWELDFVLLAALIALLAVGPGVYSLDHLFLGA